MNSIIKYLVEFFGTIFIIFVVLTTNTNWLATGIATSIAILLGKKITGAMYNPAQSISIYINGQITKIDLILYIFFQFLAAFVAVYAYKKFILKQ